MDQAPLPVTAVIAAYNREHTVERAIRSVQAQTRKPAEIIVVDDASSDRTVEVAQAAGATVIRRAQNGGAAAARNDAIAAAKHPWLAFLDSDDEWLPEHLAILWPHVGRFALVTGASIVFDESTGKTRREGVSRQRELESPAPLVFPDNFVSSGGVLVSREVVCEAGGYDETLRYSEDFELWLRVLGRRRGLALPQPVCIYHLHAGQKTRRVADARAAQIAFLERYRDEPWWSERALARRVALNECERRLLDGDRWAAGAFLLRGGLRRPATYLPVGAVLLSRRMARHRPRRFSS